ncbi:C39 family peptidase [Lignipirellula cremea]|uniref:Uncharacterized protein n=1 Tax=Lignipirellula cremea TaxID=2528010 RepID=A0A518DS48_9BACT|nr:C39 family peptidase [Lignipirellula cremea]QDU94667.1 hypothetical protein Pla8534_24730 [Lignipirellula cremea]
MEGVHLEILPQPDDTTCGPTCLHAVYQYFNDHVSLNQVIEECPTLEEGGTLAPLLGWHALGRGYQAVSYSYNLRVFDPTWFVLSPEQMIDKLQAQLAAKKDAKVQRASRAYLQFLRRGGIVKMEDLSRTLIRKYLTRSIPILAGLSSTYLYRAPREFGPKYDDDDIRGVPSGHFVVLCDYNRETKMVRVADPYLPNPLAPEDNYYLVNVDRVVGAILLGILTDDAHLLIIQPK